MSFVLLPLRKFALGSAISAVIAVTIGSGTMQQVFGQASAYLVTELSSADAGAVPSKLNNLGALTMNRFHRGVRRRKRGIRAW